MNKLLAQINFQALDQTVDSSGNPVNYWSIYNIGSIINDIVPWIFTIAGMLLLVYLIFGGLQLMVSRGDPKAAGGAKSHISNALIGFIIIFIAYWVVQLFGRIFGLTGIINIF